MECAPLNRIADYLVKNDLKSRYKKSYIHIYIYIYIYILYNSISKYYNTIFLFMHHNVENNYILFLVLTRLELSNLELSHNSVIRF